MFHFLFCRESPTLLHQDQGILASFTKLGFGTKKTLKLLASYVDKDYQLYGTMNLHWCLYTWSEESNAHTSIIEQYVTWSTKKGEHGQRYQGFDRAKTKYEPPNFCLFGAEQSILSTCLSLSKRDIRLYITIHTIRSPNITVDDLLEYHCI